MSFLFFIIAIKIRKNILDIKLRLYIFVNESKNDIV